MITLTAKITLADGTEIPINKKNALSIDGSIIDRANIILPSWGIISNTGRLSFVDYDGTIKKRAEDLKLTENLKVSILLQNTITKKEKQLNNFLTSKWDYDSNDKKVLVTLKDGLEEWQDIQIEGFDFDIRNPAKVLPNKNMADLYKWLQYRTPTKYFMKPFDSLDVETKNILNATMIVYPLLNSGTLWAQWTKLCVACGLYIYRTPQGETTCSYNYGA